MPSGNEGCVHPKIHTEMPVAALSVVAKNVNCQMSGNRRMNTLGYICTTECTQRERRSDCFTQPRGGTSQHKAEGRQTAQPVLHNSCTQVNDCSAEARRVATVGQVPVGGAQGSLWGSANAPHPGLGGGYMDACEVHYF